MTKERVREIREAMLCSITFEDGTKGHAMGTEVGCIVYQPQDNGWYLVTEYDMDGDCVAQGYDKMPPKESQVS
jgi:hypothetical protein